MAETTTDLDGAGARSKRHGPPSKVLVWGAFLWCVLAVLECALGSLLPSGVLRQPLLPLWARVAVLASDLTAMTVFVGVGVLLAFALTPLAHRVRQKIGNVEHRASALFRGFLRTLVSITGIAVMMIPIGLYVISWVSYRQLGVFPNQAAVQFMGLSGPQILQHLAQQSPGLALVGFTAVASLALLVAAGIPRLLRTLTPRVQRRLVRGAATGGLASLLLAVCGHALAAGNAKRISDPASGSTVPFRQAYSFTRANSAGAFLSALVNSWEPLQAREEPRVRRTDMRIARRPIMPMSAYVAQAQQSPQQRHNVVLLEIESMRRDELTQLGAPQVVTPNLEQVAHEGIVFSNAYSSATHSDYADPCPLISQYPLRAPFGVLPYRKDAAYPRVFIYDVLHALGYRTAMISSQNETWGDMLQFLDNGTFDYLLHSETFKGPTYVPRRDDTLRDWIKGTKRAGKIDDRFTVNEAIQWVGDGKNPTPFFIYMNLQSSHVPYEVPADFKRRFSPEGSEISFTFSELEPGQIALARSLYRDSLAYLDEQLGRFIAHLKAIGQWDNTIFVALGDTGQAFMEHNYFTHGRDLWQEVVQTTLVLRAPGVQPSINPVLARHIDVAPTILGLLGLPPHPSFHGVDLLRNPVEPRSAYLIVHTPLARQYGVVRGKHKLIKDVSRKRVLLYDLERDPQEKHDLSRQMPAIVEDLESRLDTYLAETLAYYTDRERQGREYPPAFED